MIENFFETLKKPFFVQTELDKEINKTKNSSRTSEGQHVESNYLNYDPFGTYNTSQYQNSVQSQIFQSIQNRNLLIKKWRESSSFMEIDDAISEICNEAIVYDDEERSININLDNIEMSKNIKKKIIESFEHILKLLDFDNKGDELFRQWYVDGQLNLECVYSNENLKRGIVQLINLTPYNFFSLINAEDGKKYYFYNNNPTFDTNKDFANNTKVFKSEQVVQITSGIWSQDKLFPISYIDVAIKPINQLYLIEDSLVIYRITRAPEKRVFNIDVGRLPKAKAEEYVKSLITKYRQKKIYNYETGTMVDKPKSVSILEDFWFPVSENGKGTKVETLSSTNDSLGEMPDLEYFLNKVYKALKIPLSRRDAEARLGFSTGVDIEKNELKFYKYIIKLRRKFSILFLELLKRDLITKKILNQNDWDKIKSSIVFEFASSNEFSELKQLQIIENRMTAASSASSLRADGYLSKQWIWKNIFKFTDEEIAEIKEQLSQEKNEEEGNDLDDPNSEYSYNNGENDTEFDDETTDSSDDEDNYEELTGKKPKKYIL